MHEYFFLYNFNIHLKKTNATMFFFLSSEYQIYRTNGDVESLELEKRTQSNNQAIDIVQIKGM